MSQSTNILTFMKNREYSTTIGKYPGHRLSIKEKKSHLYHYTTFDSFVKIWLSQRLLFSPLSKMNDLQEKSIRCASPKSNSIPFLLAYDKIRREYKQISFTMDYDSYLKGCMSPVMWGHYADKCNGVCIEFDTSKLSFPEKALHRPIKYKMALEHYPTLPSNIKDLEDIDRFIRKNAKRILFTKQAGWRSENEYRVVSKDDDYMDISGAITAVYLTSFKSDECLMTEKLVNGSVPVRFLNYMAALDNLSLPVLTDTMIIRKQFELDLRPAEEIEAEASEKEQAAINLLKSFSGE